MMDGVDRNRSTVQFMPYTHTHHAAAKKSNRREVRTAEQVWYTRNVEDGGAKSVKGASNQAQKKK